MVPLSFDFLTGNLFPAWKGSLFIGGLGSNHLVRLMLDGEKVIGEERLLGDLQPAANASATCNKALTELYIC